MAPLQDPLVFSESLFFRKVRRTLICLKADIAGLIHELEIHLHFLWNPDGQLNLHKFQQMGSLEGRKSPKF